MASRVNQAIRDLKALQALQDQLASPELVAYLVRAVKMARLEQLDLQEYQVKKVLEEKA